LSSIYDGQTDQWSLYHGHLKKTVLSKTKTPPQILYVHTVTNVPSTNYIFNLINKKQKKPH